MDKPFLPISGQIELLHSRGMNTDSNTDRLLRREGYYSIVNGYKKPFLDEQKTLASSDDRYQLHSEFRDMYMLFQLDRNFREVVFPYLLRSEATVKTALAYCFSEQHQEPDAYLIKENYCAGAEFIYPQHYEKELDCLISCLKDKANDKSSAFIVHYRTHHHTVPLWVLTNNLTFGNVSHFYNLVKPKEKELICKMITRAVGRNLIMRKRQLTPSKARVSLEALYKFRNMCAHDDRLYNAYVGKRKHINFIGMIKHMEPFVTVQEYDELLANLALLIEKYRTQSNKVNELLNSLGYIELLEMSPVNSAVQF